MLEFINFYVIPGIVLGSIYTLGAIGLSMLFGILRFAHFAHGDMMTLGAYIALSFVVVTGWPAIAAVPFAMVVTAGIALAIDYFFYRPLRGGRTIVIVIASFGIALMIRSAVQFFWGVQIESYQTGIQRPLIFFDSLRISERHIYIVAGAIILVTVLHWFLSRTRTGKAMRAMSDDAELAAVTGINRAHIVACTGSSAPGSPPRPASSSAWIRSIPAQWAGTCFCRCSPRRSSVPALCSP